MEHRNGGRGPVQVSVVIFHQGLPLFSGTTRNISAGGLFLSTPVTLFRPGDRVGLEVCFSEGGQMDRYRLAATVVHSRIDGIGLEFASVDASLVKRLYRRVPGLDLFHLEDEGRALFHAYSPPDPWCCVTEGLAKAEATVP